MLPQSFTKLSHVLIICIVMMVVFACSSKEPADATQTVVSTVASTTSPSQPPQDFDSDEGEGPQVAWASGDKTVLVRWFGRAAAGLAPYDPDGINAKTVLPGSPSAPALTVERSEDGGATFGVLETGITRITDEAQAAALIGDWWVDITKYVSGYQYAASVFLGGPAAQKKNPQDITLSEVYEVFDLNPMAAASWANKHHGIALLLGMGYLDVEVQNGVHVKYRVSLEQGVQGQTLLGVTDEITVGQNGLAEPDAVTVSSETKKIIDAELTLSSPDDATDDDANDADWLIDQGYNRWVHQKIFIGWDIGANTASSFKSGYNIYRRPVDENLNPIADYVKINDFSVLPGGSVKGGIQESVENDKEIGFVAGNDDPINAVGEYDLANPEGYYFVDDKPDQNLPDDQVYYCYTVTAIDLLGAESSKSPSLDQEDVNCARFQDLIPPDVPAELTAELVGNEVELRWLSVEGADTYSVYRAETGQGESYPHSPDGWGKVTEGVFGDEFEGGNSYTVFTEEVSLPENDDEEKDYWYRVRSWDSNDNRSPLSQPVYVFLRDSFPPGPPEIASSGIGHGKSPSGQLVSTGPCIRVNIDTDTDYVEIYRALDDGSYELVATILADEDNWVEWCDEHLDGIAGWVESEYLAQAHDSDGNSSWSEGFVTASGDGSLFDAPVIVEVIFEPAQAGIGTNKITWHADLFPEFDRFNIYKFDGDEDYASIEALIQSGNQQPIGTVLVNQAQDLWTGFATALFKDVGVYAGQSDFYYVVSSERDPGGNPDIVGEAFSDPYKAPLGDLDDLQYALRSIKRGAWCAPLKYTPGEGIHLNWDPYWDSAGYPENFPCPTSRHKGDFDWGAHLIFRSRSKDSGYVQIAPVIGGPTNPPASPANPYYGKPDEPDKPRGIEYLDEDADHGTYWYVIVTVDPDTGEPISVTSPNSIQIDALKGLPEDGFSDFRCRPEKPPKLTTIDAPATLIFGANEKYEAIVTVCEWTAVSQPEREVVKGGGTGYAVFGDLTGGEYRVKISFNSIQATASGVVTAGTAEGVHGAIVLTGAGQFDYSIENIVLDPKGSYADVRVLLDTSFNLVENGDKFGYIDLDKTWVTRKFEFSANKVMSNGLPDGVSEIDYEDQGWADDIDWYLVMDELPVAFVAGQINITPTTISSPEKMYARYYERFKGRGILGPIDRVPVNQFVNSNDALLQQTVFFVDGFEASSKGINATLSTEQSVYWISSVPYFLRTFAGGANITMLGSEIVGGNIGNGAMSIDYMPEHDVLPFSEFIGEFPTLNIGKGGLVEGDIGSDVTTGWAKGFTVEKDFGGNWNMYVPPISSVDLPAAQPNFGTKSFKLDSPTDDTHSLWDPLVTSPSWNMPGVNASGSGKVKWICDGKPFATFPADVDMYIRRGGVSHVIGAQVAKEPIDADLYGYSIDITTADLGFLDSELVYHNVGMKIDLPFPADFSYAGNVTEFNDACPVKIASPSGGSEVLADHWNLRMNITVAEFLKQPVDPNTQERLFLSGGVNLPHNLDDAGEPVEWVPMRTKWEPDGTSGGTRFNEVPVVKFDGLHYLLKSNNGVTLSDDSEPAPDIRVTANVLDPEFGCGNQCPGWITYDGSITVPYFGPLRALVSAQGEDSEDSTNSSEIQLHVYTSHEDTVDKCKRCVDYIGSNGLKAEQVWISEIGLGLDFPLVIAKKKGEEGLILTGIDHTRLLPDEVAEMIKFDSSVVIDSGTQTDMSIFIGLSSVPASVKSIADALDISGDNPPDDEDIERWLERQWHPGSDDLRLYIGSDQIDGIECKSVLHQLWGGNWDDYTETYDVLNKAIEHAAENPDEGCFDISAIESAIDGGNEDKAQQLTKLMGLGGGAGEALKFEESDYKLAFHLVRGEVAFTDNGDNPGGDFERFDLALRTKIAEAGEGPGGWKDGGEIFLETPHLSFSYNKSGAFTIDGEYVKAHMFTYDIEHVDFELMITTAPGNKDIQGGLTYYDGFELEAITLGKIAGVFGFGESVLYAGLMGDGTLEEFGAAVGASLLFGRINSASKEILEDNGFEQLVEKISLDNGGMTGVYARALGEIPIVQDGCWLKLSVGGEVEVWYFTGGSGSAYGGSLRGYAHGEALCVVSARGDVTFAMYKKQINGQDALKFEGEGWIAGGLTIWPGSCEPGDWGSTWKGRWWGDDLCWQAGAAAEIIWKSKEYEDKGWSYSLDADYE